MFIFRRFLDELVNIQTAAKMHLMISVLITFTWYKNVCHGCKISYITSHWLTLRSSFNIQCCYVHSLTHFVHVFLKKNGLRLFREHF